MLLLLLPVATGDNCSWDPLQVLEPSLQPISAIECVERYRELKRRLQFEARLTFAGE